MTLHFTDIVDQAEEQPLRIHLLSSAQSKAIQSMCVPDISEYGLNSPKPPTVLIATLIGVDLPFHFIEILLGFSFRAPEHESHLAEWSAIRVLEATCS